MSEPIIERLSRFTPNAGGLDRDALLFAAGRASARPNRRWISLASVLAGTQVLSLAFLWPRTPPDGLGTTVASAPPRQAIIEAPAVESPVRSGVWSARHHPPASEIEDRPFVDVTLIETAPPLRATGSSRPALFN